MAKKPRNAWNDALAALARRALTSRELRRKLRRHHDEDSVDETLRRLVEARYVDDDQVAYNHAFARAKAGRRGPLRVKAELLARGVDREAADAAVSAAYPDDELPVAVGRAAAFIDRRADSAGAERDEDGDRRPREARERTARKLMTAGFPHSAVAAWLSRSRGAGYGENDEFP